MSDTKFKEALSNLDPDTRVCLLYLDRQIKEVSIRPLKAMSDIENNVTNALNTVNKYNDRLVKALDMLSELDSKLTPEYWEDLKKSTKEEVESSVKTILEDYFDRLDKERRLMDKRLKKLDEGYKKFEKLFSDKSYGPDRARMRKKKIK